ncbi:MAG: sodium:solute symporter [Bdellovibrionales bacterium]
MVLLLTTVGSMALARHFNRRMSATKEGLIAADRNLGLWEASLSIAASWIWAPALFVAAQKAFQDGVIGLFWFIVPNVLCLVGFAFFATRVRHEHPDGFTLSAYIRQKTSARVQSLYWLTLTGLAVCAFAVQLLAGGQLLSSVTTLPFVHCSFILAAIPLSYSLFSGLKATIVTDVAKMIFVYATVVFLVPWAIWAEGGIDSVINGLGGQIHDTDFFGSQSLRIFFVFGLPTTIGLLAGPFGDQTFWQRLFAIRQKHVRAAFFNGAWMFALVPLALSLLGFAAAGGAIAINDPQIVNLEFIRHALPPIAVWWFVLMILAALISILDTKLTGIASLAAHDFTNGLHKNPNYGHVVTNSRLAMLTLTILALLIANIPGLKVLHLFLFYGTLRSATVIPTILLILGKQLPEHGVFFGILTSLFLGLPLFSYGNLSQQPALIVLGSLLTVSASGVIACACKPKADGKSPSAKL